MTNENQHHETLNNDQIETLCRVIVDQFGSDLSEETLIEFIYLVLEDVPGIEMESDQSIQHIINQIRIIYHGNQKSW